MSGSSVFILLKVRELLFQWACNSKGFAIVLYTLYTKIKTYIGIIGTPFLKHNIRKFFYFRVFRIKCIKPLI